MSAHANLMFASLLDVLPLTRFSWRLDAHAKVNAVSQRLSAHCHTALAMDVYV